MMKLFRVELQSIAFDEDDSMVILADSAQRALELAKQNWRFRLDENYSMVIKNGREINFNIIEIDLSFEQIVDSSHYGD